MAPEELWTKVWNTVREPMAKISPKKKKRRKARWLSEEVLQAAEQRGEAKGKGEEKTHGAECRVSENSWEG